jgi:2-polyprenyl-3-methyl-5-hydroxy-6-metoxy-1,4-benzoquinol methylase
MARAREERKIILMGSANVMNSLQNLKSCDFCQGNFILIHRTKGYYFGRCAECGLYYVPMSKLDNEKIVEFYQNYGHNVTLIRKHDSSWLEIMEYVFKKRIQTLKKYANISTHKPNFLDVGCGLGYFVYAAQKANWEAYGVEIDRTAWRFATSKLGIAVINMFIEEANFNSNYFDVVQLESVLEHVQSPTNLLREVHRILKPGGGIILGVPNQAGLLLY